MRVDLRDGISVNNDPFINQQHHEHHDHHYGSMFSPFQSIRELCSSIALHDVEALGRAGNELLTAVTASLQQSAASPCISSPCIFLPSASHFPGDRGAVGLLREFQGPEVPKVKLWAKYEGGSSTRQTSIYSASKLLKNPGTLLNWTFCSRLFGLG